MSELVKKDKYTMTEIKSVEKDYTIRFLEAMILKTDTQISRLDKRKADLQKERDAYTTLLNEAIKLGIESETLDTELKDGK